MDGWQRLAALVRRADHEERELIRALVLRLMPVAEIEARLAADKRKPANRPADAGTAN